MNFFFFRITWRSLTKRGVFAVVNILGLSISLAVVLIMYLQIDHELSIDKSFKESENIYRVNARWLSTARAGEISAITHAGLAQSMKDNLPGVKEAVRVWNRAHILKAGDYESDTRINFTDAGFFDLFDAQILYGSVEEVLERPGDALALSETEAKKIFGDRNPVGETILWGPQTLEIGAVYKDFPMNSSFYGFHIICRNPPPYYTPQAKFAVVVETFVLLHEKTDTTGVGQPLRRIWNEDVKEVRGEDAPFTLELQELNKIHLHSSHITGSSTTTPGNIEHVKMLTLLAVIILLIACINYMNLATARAQKRSREIGISKTIGAKRYELASQLILETGMLTVVSFIVALGLAYLLLPVFNSLLNVQLYFGLVLNIQFLLGALAILFLTTLIAASYPAFYLSGFQPVTAIRAAAIRGSKNAFVRQTLIVSQFVASIVLITWVIVIYTQIRYIDNKNMGFNITQIISFWIRTNPGPDFSPFENTFRAQSSVLDISRVSFFPTIGDQVLLKTDINDEGVLMTVCNADEHLIDLVQLQMIAGTPLPARLPNDTIARMVLNRKAVEYLGSTPEDIIGRRINVAFNEPVEVCGVVENFNYESLHRPIGEYGIHNSRFGRGRFYLMARVNSHDLPGQLETYKKIFNEFYPNDMFDVHYPDLEVKDVYKGTQTTGNISLTFSILAILIACMGVFGLTAFMAEQRTKEIGIRKVMGASVLNIVSLFTHNYMKLLGISLVIAIPIAWWVGEQYLQDYAYRISLSWWMFAVAALITVVLTLMTVCFQALKSALINPVDAIRAE
ncbi:MAG: ABC transporter permease [Tannerella sp.]|jgi:ABC-type lipoprotein release transport system permease subunit|nr:ABC transporter permease [Tannerella sp.]